MQHFRILESRIFLKKSHTCKQGGAHLRISFWHLFMNFEKLEKSEFWENEKKKKKCWRYHFTHVYQKPQSYEVHFLGYGVRQIFFCHFGQFFALYSPTFLTTQRTKILKKWKKHPEIWPSIFCPLTLLWIQKIKILKK